jgi:hypothetical protein
MSGHEIKTIGKILQNEKSRDRELVILLSGCPDNIDSCKHFYRVYFILRTVKGTMMNEADLLLDVLVDNSNVTPSQMKQIMIAKGFGANFAQWRVENDWKKRFHWFVVV